MLNPLMTPTFNADFDGDQMHLSVPQSEMARKEMRQVVNSTNNLYLARDGSCHVAPRHEIIYGLWKACKTRFDKKNPPVYRPQDVVATVVSEAPSGSSMVGTAVLSEQKFLKTVCDMAIDIDDTVIWNGKLENAGTVALRIALGKFGNYRLGVSPLTTNQDVEESNVTEKWFKELIGAIAEKDKGAFVRVVNNLVALGFAVATNYPPNIAILKHPDVTKCVQEFDDAVIAREELYNRGFETKESYTRFYMKQYKKLEKDIEKLLENDPDMTASGFADMVAAKAHASKSNIMQLFGIKGLIKKNESESFNAIIKHSLVQQLDGLEHFVTTYGSRTGVVDKVIKTYKPGYISRQMSQATNYLRITCEDCGTTNGLKIDYETIRQFLKPDHRNLHPNAVNREVSDYIVQMLVGRYIVEVPGEDPIDSPESARYIYDKYISPVTSELPEEKRFVKLRSPITCENPCCVKCYGIELSKRKKVTPGTAIGYIAAGSVGEPGTQLIMKNFQGGGVAGAANLTSSFDLLIHYLDLFDSKAQSANNIGGAISYDFIAPCEGQIESVSMGNGTKRIYINQVKPDGTVVNGLKNNKVFVYDDVKLKDYVHVGDSIQEIQGNLDIREMLKYRTPEEAQLYLSLFLYDLYREQVFVNSKHFETLVAGMTYYICLKGNSNFVTGGYYMPSEYWTRDREGAIFKKTLKGMKEVPLYRQDFFGAVFFENLVKGVSRAIIMSGEDTLSSPLTRISFGLRSGVGTDNADYIS